MGLNSEDAPQCTVAAASLGSLWVPALGSPQLEV